MQGNDSPNTPNAARVASTALNASIEALLTQVSFLSTSITTSPIFTYTSFPLFELYSPLTLSPLLTTNSHYSMPYSFMITNLYHHCLYLSMLPLPPSRLNLPPTLILTNNSFTTTLTTSLNPLHFTPWFPFSTPTSLSTLSISLTT